MSDEALPMYPFVFQPIYKSKVWGGQRFRQALDRSDVPDTGKNQGTGESWEIVDLGRTSKSGGGGGSERSVVENGPLQGKTLHKLMNKAGKQLMGDLSLNEFGEFPLLVKFLDANDNLSVQVHPSPDYAKSHDDAYLKSEAWYVITAEPGAVIYKGMKQGATPEQLRAALEQNTVDAVVPLMETIPVQPGDCHYLPSGTCHALGEGVLVAEVQTPSDTTFRVFDWGRTGRELHVEQALQCIHFGPAQSGSFEPNTTLESQYGQIRRLVACEYFRMDEVKLRAGHQQKVSYNQPTIWMVIEGKGDIACDAVASTPFTKGRTLLLPPGMTNGNLKLDTDATLIEVTFPQADKKQLA